MSPLVQIRQAFRARWQDLTLMVVSEDQQWTLRVQDAGNDRLLYTAGRANRAAAEVAGAEFALLRSAATDSTVSPEAMARSLQWQRYW